MQAQQLERGSFRYKQQRVPLTQRVARVPRSPPARRCPLEEGCGVPGASSANISFPYQGCQLLDLNAFLRTSVNTGEIKVSGANVPFTTGARRRRRPEP